MYTHLLAVCVISAVVGIAVGQPCRICGPSSEAQSCTPNDPLPAPLPDKIQIQSTICDEIENNHKDYHNKLCEKYPKPNGYYYECTTPGTTSTFSCRSSCGPPLEDVGKGLKGGSGLFATLNNGQNRGSNLFDFNNFNNDQQSSTGNANFGNLGSLGNFDLLNNQRNGKTRGAFRDGPQTPFSFNHQPFSRTVQFQPRPQQPPGAFPSQPNTPSQGQSSASPGQGLASPGQSFPPRGPAPQGLNFPPNQPPSNPQSFEPNSPPNQSPQNPPPGFGKNSPQDQPSFGQNFASLQPLGLPQRPANVNGGQAGSPLDDILGPSFSQAGVNALSFPSQGSQPDGPLHNATASSTVNRPDSTTIEISGSVSQSAKVNGSSSDHEVSQLPHQQQSGQQSIGPYPQVFPRSQASGLASQGFPGFPQVSPGSPNQPVPLNTGSSPDLSANQASPRSQAPPVPQPNSGVPGRVSGGHGATVSPRRVEQSPSGPSNLPAVRPVNLPLTTQSGSDDRASGVPAVPSSKGASDTQPLALIGGSVNEANALSPRDSSNAEKNVTSQGPAPGIYDVPIQNTQTSSASSSSSASAFPSSAQNIVPAEAFQNPLKNPASKLSSRRGDTFDSNPAFVGTALFSEGFEDSPSLGVQQAPRGPDAIDLGGNELFPGFQQFENSGVTDSMGGGNNNNNNNRPSSAFSQFNQPGSQAGPSPGGLNVLGGSLPAGRNFLQNSGVGGVFNPDFLARPGRTVSVGKAGPPYQSGPADSGNSLAANAKGANLNNQGIKSIKNDADTGSGPFPAGSGRGQFQPTAPGANSNNYNNNLGAFQNNPGTVAGFSTGGGVGASKAASDGASGGFPGFPSSGAAGDGFAGFPSSATSGGWFAGFPSTGSAAGRGGSQTAGRDGAGSNGFKESGQNSDQGFGFPGSFGSFNDHAFNRDNGEEKTFDRSLFSEDLFNKGQNTSESTKSSSNVDESGPKPADLELAKPDLTTVASGNEPTSAAAPSTKP